MDFDGLDKFEIMELITKKKQRYLALELNDVEEAMQNCSKEDFELVRKIILDVTNDLTRSIARIIFGEDIEGLNYR
jgi:phage-related protein